MPFIGASNKTRATKTTIDHKYYLGGHADTIANPGYYTFYVHYVPGNITVIVRGIHMAESDFIALSGTDVRIRQSDITLNPDDSIELIGFGMPAADVLERSDVSITGGQAINLEKVDAKYYMNRNEYTADLTVPAGYNAFFAGPINFTGTLNVEGTLNII